MFGLSATAIGLRSPAQAVAIFEALRGPLELGFYELAIGVINDVDAPYPDVPLVLHDNCLYRGRERLRLRPEHGFGLPPEAHLRAYLDFIERHNVLCVHVHAGRRDAGTLAEQERYLRRLQARLPVPLYVEVMPTSRLAAPQFWASDPQSLPDWPLLLDVSHVKVWCGGDAERTCETVLHLLQHHSVAQLHLSDNDGREDSHDLVPADVWFAPYLADWSRRYPCTWESLPVAYAQYERLDRRRRSGAAAQRRVARNMTR